MTDEYRYGDFATLGSPISEAAVESRALDFVVQWKRCGLVADFFASFFSYAFEARDTATNVLSTIVNELVENAVKFSRDKAQLVRIRVRHFGETIAIEAENRTDEPHVRALRIALERVGSGDPEALFAAQVESPAGDGSASGVGLIVLRKDYDAAIAARIANDASAAEAARFVVTVRATVRAEEVEQR